MSDKFIVDIWYDGPETSRRWLAKALADGDVFAAASPELAVGYLFKCVNAARQFCRDSWLDLPVEELGKKVMEEQGYCGICIILRGEYKG